MKTVALKIVKMDCKNEKKLKKFLKLMKMLNSLDHPNILKVIILFFWYLILIFWLFQKILDTIIEDD